MLLKQYRPLQLMEKLLVRSFFSLFFGHSHSKRLATGACDCVGMPGPGLGGGFGRYQGYFGLVTDNIINLKVVIADGSILNVSATSYPDLFLGNEGRRAQLRDSNAI